jgi:Epoxide hydrolase N terminus
MKIAPFTIDVSSAAVADLARRLEMTRWPDEVGEGGWEYGMPCRVLRDVVDHWRDRFDWRAAERRLNGLPQFQIEIDGRVVHYVHVRGVDQESAALVLTHGWPGSFVEMYKIIPMLTDPASNGLPEPPSTRSVSPVIQRASSEARKTMAAPMSSAWAMRLSAWMPSVNSRPASVLAKLDMSVGTTPGATALTRMPRSPKAAAKCLTKVSMAPLVAA